MRPVLICSIVLTMSSAIFGQQKPLTSLYDLQADDFTEITNFIYIDEGKLTVPRVDHTITTFHHIKRTRKEGGIIYFEYTNLWQYSWLTQKNLDSYLFRTKDGQEMQGKTKIGSSYIGGWTTKSDAIITTDFNEADSIVYESGKKYHNIVVTWSEIKNILYNDAYKEIRKRVKHCTDCTLVLTVKESKDFFGTTFDTTGVDLYRPGYWFSAGAEGQYGRVGFIRPAGKISGPFSMHSIRIPTMSRLHGISR